jgi:hypothetical protein
MNTKKFNFTTNDFLSGKYDTEFQDALQGVNLYNDSISEFTPIRPNHGWQAEFDKIARNFPQIPFIISSWQSNVGAHDSTVTLSIDENNSQSTQKRKKAVQKRVYSLIYTKNKWKSLELEIVQKIAIEGNAVLMLNAYGKLIIESINRFNVYFDKKNKVSRYSYLSNGSEVEGMKNLEHGVDLWHIKDPVFSGYPVAPSRLQAAMAMILLENKATGVNTHMFANGWLSNIFLKFKEAADGEVMKKLTDTTKDGNNKTWKDRIMDIFNNKSRGVKNAGKVGIIPYLDDLIRVSVTNKDSQYLEMMKELTPERVAWAYSMTFSNFGAGSNLTENNASTFDDALYDKFGRSMEQLLDEARNEFVLKLEGVITSENFYIKYSEPEDPKKLLEVKEKREDLKSDAMTVNEYREFRGLPPLPGGDVTLSAWTTPSLPQPDPNVIDAVASNNRLRHDPNFFTKAVEFATKKTPTEKALETEQYTKFYNRFEKALSKQLKAWLDSFIEENPTNLEKYEVKLPKLESFYAFNVLKKDLLIFAGFGLDEVKKDKRIKFKAEFFDGEYPQVVLDSIDQRTEMLLKGLGDYKGLDAETTQKINTYLAQNASKGVSELTAGLVELVKKMSPVRAEMIASTEVANAVEGTRHTMYLKNFPNGKKEWQTCQDERVRESHRDNQAEGQISIDQAFSNGNDRAGEDVRCRCTTLYFPE